MIFEERPLTFQCNDSWLYGILSLPEQVSCRGVLVVVGGPQYRVGSHRQFTLFARDLAAHGVPVLRFDCRGMGDSEGDMRTFEDFEDDLRCAVDQFFKEVPVLNDLIIWGLCDAASAALFYAYKDPRITGLALLNPWVRTNQGVAKTYLKHYYRARLFEAELWSKIWRGNFHYSAAVRSFSRIIAEALERRKKTATAVEQAIYDKSSSLASLPERMLQGLRRFEGKVLVVISGNDLTAREFLDLVKSSREWQKLLASPRVSSLELPEANHTFSRRKWRDEIAVHTRHWIQSW
jgi:exosortase A-associated hydrolase 1